MAKPLIVATLKQKMLVLRPIDDDTLVVTLENPTAYFLKLLAAHSFYPVSKKAVDAHENWAANAETMVSNGPYRFVVLEA